MMLSGEWGFLMPEERRKGMEIVKMGTKKRGLSLGIVENIH